MGIVKNTNLSFSDKNKLYVLYILLILINRLQASVVTTTNAITNNKILFINL